MPPSSEQQNLVQPLTTTIPTGSNVTIKIIRIFLLVLVVVGVGLIGTYQLWMSGVIHLLLPNQAPLSTNATTTSSIVADQNKPFSWISIAELSSDNPSGYHERNGQIYLGDATSSIVGADAASFVVSSGASGFGDEDFAKDNAHLYDGGVVIDVYDGSHNKVANLDTSTFTLVYDKQNQFTGFAKDKEYVYAYGGDFDRLVLVPVDGVDPRTFESLSFGIDSHDSYFKDAKHVYIGSPIYINEGFSYLMQQADAATFQILYEDALRNEFGKDKNNVYYGSDIVTGADPATFISLSSTTPYFKDDQHVYLEKSEIPGADPASFIFLGGWYGKDKVAVYEKGQMVQGADRTTFTWIAGDNSEYGKDDKYVYFPSSSPGAHVVQGADPQTFVYIAGDGINYELGKDGEHVYFDNYPILTADPSTFVYMGGNYAKDKNRAYVFGRNFANVSAASVTSILGVDIATFSYMPNTSDAEYAKDKSHIYWGGQLMIGADPITFTIVQIAGYQRNSCGTNCRYDAQDKNHTYWQGQVVQ